MSPKIPLLRLPLLPFEKILDSLNLGHLIELSLLSEKLYDRIHRSRGVRRNDVEMNVRVTECSEEVHLKSDSRGTFCVSSWRMDREMDCLEARYICVDEDEEERVDWDRKNRKNDFLFWCQYLKKFFHKTSIPDFVFWPQGPSDIDKFFKKNDILRNAKRISIRGEFTMSQEDTEFLLDNLSADQLTLVVAPKNAEGTRFQYDKKIRFSQLAMHDLSWLSEEQLLDLLTTTRRIEIKDSPILTETFLNKLLTQWFNSSNVTLQEVQIWSKPYANPSEIPVFDKMKVLEGITGRVIGEEESLAMGITIPRDKDTTMTIQVTRTWNKLGCQCYFRDWR